jgi:uncharacterized protein (DUF779 family)
METRQFNIPTNNIKSVEKQIEKLNRRATKLGLDSIQLTWDKPSINSSGILVATATLTGPFSISFDGWEFIATLQHLPTGENIIRSISDQDLPTQYHNSGSACEHCNVNRYRKDTYIVKKDISFLQIGSTCIKDFLGGNSPDNIMQRAQLIAGIMSFMRGSCEASAEVGFNIETFLAHTIAIVNEFGWVSKTDAKETGKMATATRVIEALTTDEPQLKLPINNALLEDAKIIADWVENIPDITADNSDYLHNIRAIARAGMVGIRTAGFAASMVSCYNRENAKPKERVVSQHVGEVKSRQSFELTVKNMFSGQSNFGEYFKYIFTDKAGNILVWSASKEQDLEINHNYTVVGTVKQHTYYKDVAQTVLTRCNIEFENV